MRRIALAAILVLFPMGCDPERPPGVGGGGGGPIGGGGDDDDAGPPTDGGPGADGGSSVDLDCRFLPEDGTPPPGATLTAQNTGDSSDFGTEARYLDVAWDCLSDQLVVHFGPDSECERDSPGILEIRFDRTELSTLAGAVPLPPTSEGRDPIELLYVDVFQGRLDAWATCDPTAFGDFTFGEVPVDEPGALWQVTDFFVTVPDCEEPRDAPPVRVTGSFDFRLFETSVTACATE